MYDLTTKTQDVSSLRVYRGMYLNNAIVHSRIIVHRTRSIGLFPHDGGLIVAHVEEEWNRV